MIQIAMTMTITGTYQDFGKAADAALKMTAAQQGKQLAAADRKAILEEIKRLPPHPDVRPALDALRKKGLRIAALTNSTRKTAEAQLDASEFLELFEKVLSVDKVKRYKPAREAYEYAARELGVAANEILLVAHTPGTWRGRWPRAARQRLSAGPESRSILSAGNLT